MGCCCSSNAEDIYENGETNDRRNLLGSPDGDSSRGPKYNTDNTERFAHSVEKVDEQEKLNKILQQTANSYIDVPALNSPVEQPSCSTTEKHYATKSQEVLERHISDETKAPLLSASKNPEKVLSNDPLPASDRLMVNEFSSLVVGAISAIEVSYTEDIIIPFDGPSAYQ